MEQLSYFHTSAVVADRLLSSMSTEIVTRNEVCQAHNHTQISIFPLQSMFLHSSLARHTRLSECVLGSDLHSVLFITEKERWYSAVLSRPHEEPSRYNRN